MQICYHFFILVKPDRADGTQQPRPKSAETKISFFNRKKCKANRLVSSSSRNFRSLDIVPEQLKPARIKEERISRYSSLAGFILHCSATLAFPVQNIKKNLLIHFYVTLFAMNGKILRKRKKKKEGEHSRNNCLSNT